MIILVVALLLMSSAAGAQTLEHYIGLFTDETHSYWCASSENPFYPVEVWIMCKPGINGIICNELDLCNPPNVIGSTMTYNTDIIGPNIPPILPGIAECYIECQYDWFWLLHRTYYVTDAAQTHISVCPYPSSGVIGVAECTPGYPRVEGVPWTNFYVNYGPGECPAIATKDESWGAIKSMVSE
jgi:hypothetical protein